MAKMRETAPEYAEYAELSERWRGIGGVLHALKADGITPMDPLQGGEAYGGAIAALQLHGVDTVLAVIEHSVREAERHRATDGQGGTDPRLVATMFRGQGFGARHAEWLKAQRRGVQAGVPREISGRKLSDKERQQWAEFKRRGLPDDDIASMLRESWGRTT